MEIPIRGAAAGAARSASAQDYLVINSPIGLIPKNSARLMRLHICVLIGCRVISRRLMESAAPTGSTLQPADWNTQVDLSPWRRRDTGPTGCNSVSAFCLGRDRPHWPDLTPLSPEILLIPYLSKANWRPSVY